MGSVFVAGSVASLHGVSDQDSGVASAVQNISFTVGSILGVAILSTVAAATTGQSSSHADAAEALIAGYRTALAAAAVIAMAGLAATTMIIGRRHTAEPGSPVAD
jgi:hypothetical protein